MPVQTTRKHDLNHRWDETSNPVDIKVRSIMKGQFLDALAGQDYGEVQAHFPHAALVIYGSTLVRQLTKDGAKIPFAGLRSSDIDIGCYLHKGASTTPAREQFIEHITPVLRDALKERGYDLIFPGSAPGNASRQTNYSNAEISSVPPELLCGDFYAVKHFSQGQIEAMLKPDPDYGKLKPYIDAAFKNEKEHPVYLALSAHPEHFPLILEPKPLFPRNHGATRAFLNRADRFDHLAGGIARTMGNNPKSSDILSIYNLIHATDANNKPLIPRDEESLDMVRMLVLTYMLCGYGHFDYKSDTLLDRFKPTAANKEKFIASTRNKIIEYRQQELYGKLDSIYGDVNDFIGQVFRVRRQDGPTFGPLHLSYAEAQFIHTFNGQRLVEKEKKTSRWDLQRLTKRGQPVAKEYETVYPRDSADRYAMDISLLKDAAYPKLFASHPEIEDALRRNTLLQGKLAENQYGRSSVQDFE